MNEEEVPSQETTIAFSANQAAQVVADVELQGVVYAESIEQQMEAVIDAGAEVQADKPTEADLMLEQPDISKTGEQAPSGEACQAPLETEQANPSEPIIIYGGLFPDHDKPAMLALLGGMRFLTEEAAQSVLDRLIDQEDLGQSYRVAKAVIPTELYQLKPVGNQAQG